MAGHTPAGFGARKFSDFGSDVSQDGTSTANSMDVTQPAQIEEIPPQLPQSSAIQGEIRDILENYADFDEDEMSAPAVDLPHNPPTNASKTFQNASSSTFETVNETTMDSLPSEMTLSSTHPPAPQKILTPPRSPLPSINTIPDTFDEPSPPKSPSKGANHFSNSRLSHSPPPLPNVPQVPSSSMRPPQAPILEALPKLPQSRIAQDTHLREALDNSFMATQDETQLPPGARKIPGPAGQLPPLKSLAQMHKLEQAAKESEALARASQAPVSHSRSLHAQKMEDQTDFRTGAWLQMLCDQDMRPYGSNKLSTSLSWIRRVGWKKEVPTLIVHVKSLRLVEDDYRAVLRDPTGTFENSTISKTVSEKFADFSIGCVLMLKDISVFTPSKGKSYLVITPENVVRVWPKTEMSRQELAQLSHRVYNYTCIYEAIALPPSVNEGALMGNSSNRNHPAGAQPSQRYGPPPAATAVYQSARASTTHSNNASARGAAHNPFDGPRSIPGMPGL